MSHAELCPVCGGSGKLPDESSGTSTAPTAHPCHGCGGLGWVPVRDWCYPCPPLPGYPVPYPPHPDEIWVGSPPGVTGTNYSSPLEGRRRV